MRGPSISFWLVARQSPTETRHFLATPGSLSFVEFELLSTISGAVLVSAGRPVCNCLQLLDGISLLHAIRDFGVVHESASQRE